MKNKILLLLTVFMFMQACSQKTYNELIDNKSVIVDKEVIELNKNGATKILSMYDNSDNAFVFWEEDNEFKGKKIIFKNVKSLKEKRVSINDDIKGLLEKSFNNLDLLNEISNEECSEGIRICKKIYLRMYEKNNLKVDNEFFYIFESQNERKKIEYLLDLYNHLAVW